VSSAASGNELSPSPSESWTASRPSSGTWDDVNDSSSKKDFPLLVSWFLLVKGSIEIADVEDSPSQLSYAMSRQVNITQAGAFTGSRNVRIKSKANGMAVLMQFLRMTGPKASHRSDMTSLAQMGAARSSLLNLLRGRMVIITTQHFRKRILRIWGLVKVTPPLAMIFH
jgi:hypothetical protein